jgi:hypothetical protein
MSKHHTRNLYSLHTFFAAMIACGGFVLFVDTSLAQDGGYSIFEPAEESVEVAEEAAPIVVSPKEAFTNPAATLPKAQFGSFKNTGASENAPKLSGSQAVGTYTNDGRSMFKAPPNTNPDNSRKLQPFASNTLRGNNRPQQGESASQAPPVVVGDFQNSARRLSAAAPQGSNAKALTTPKIAQVTYQDGGGFNPTNGAQEKPTGSRFGQTSPNRFTQQTPSAPATSRFGSGQTRPQQPLSQRTAQPRQPSRLPAAQPSSRFSQRSTSSQGPAARMAARPQSPMGQGQGLRQRQGQRPGQVQQQNQRLDSIAKSTDLKTGSKGAKELLSTWVEKEASQFQLPGKRMTLKSFLAQPINGSRKAAINQYWLTFNDMANHKIAVEQSQWLGSIGNIRQPADQAVLTAAQQAAANRVLHTEIQLAKSQSLLHEFLPNLRDKNGKIIPVLPADIPWVGKLNTNYKEYQSRGIVPQKFNGIDEILPKQRQLIANRADAVTAASKAAEQAKNAMASGAPISNVLEAARIKGKNQQDFLQSVIGYNRAITDYVLTVRQDIYQPQRLASVLIGRKAVQQSIAKQQKPQEDVDSFDSAESNPTMRQVSANRSLQSSSERRLQGKSAYQNSSAQEQVETTEQSLGNSLLNQNKEKTQSDSSRFSQASSARQSPEATQRFDYGPTASSAKAANFNPSEVKEELPMQKAQQASSSSLYNGNGSGGNAANAQNRSATNTMQQPPRRNRSSFGDQPAAAQGNRPVDDRAATFQDSPQRRFGGGAGTGGTQPITQSPFTPKGVAAPTTAPGGSRAKSAFGGGTFGGAGASAAPKIPAATTGVRFGSSSATQ